MFKSHDFHLFGRKLNIQYMGNFHPQEVRDRVSETQFQMDENLNNGWKIK